MKGIEVFNLSKRYDFYKINSDLKSIFGSLVKRETQTKLALNGISFSIESGEMVGLLGANGSGKTTTMKLLTGILCPTTGSILVDGFVPNKREEHFKRKIAMVFGQKTQLWWDLPAVETLQLNKIIYGVDDNSYKKIVTELTELLHVTKLMNVPVRRLSLGERMKFELIAALIHQPSFLFLDEPTIGLDILSQKDFHEFLLKHNKTYGTTIILTSHYMQDIEKLCKRSIVLREGQIVYNGETSRISDNHLNCRLELKFKESVNPETLMCYGEAERLEDQRVTISVRKEESKAILIKLLETYDIEDFSVQPPTLEECIQEYFRTDGAVQ